MSAREHFDDPRMERLQARISDLETKLQAIPFASGARVSMAVATSATRVAHRLGRVPRGVLVLRAEPDSALGFSTTQPSDTNIAVHLEASANASFDLWFF